MKRFWDKTVKQGECLVWTGTKNPIGYGGFQVDGKRRLAHRVAYQLTKGEIPTGLEIDHLCRNKSCVNPEHLEVVTRSVNCLRKLPCTHCKYGHEFTKANTWIEKDGHRHCRHCHADRNWQGILGRRKYAEVKEQFDEA